MAEDHEVHFSTRLPETVLAPYEPDVLARLALAEQRAPAERRDAVAAVAASSPRCLAAWASLAELAENDVARYAYARVGYHRGLDALRGAGWRGSGLVRWSEPANRGFLRCLEQLRRAAEAIGEDDEEVRCALMLAEMEPQWPLDGTEAATPGPQS
jgi:hypothetical protein